MEQEDQYLMKGFTPEQAARFMDKASDYNSGFKWKRVTKDIYLCPEDLDQLADVFMERNGSIDQNLGVWLSGRLHLKKSRFEVSSYDRSKLRNMINASGYFNDFENVRSRLEDTLATDGCLPRTSSRGFEIEIHPDKDSRTYYPLIRDLRISQAWLLASDIDVPIGNLTYRPDSDWRHSHDDWGVSIGSIPDVYDFRVNSFLLLQKEEEYPTRTERVEQVKQMLTEQHVLTGEVDLKSLSAKIEEMERTYKK